MSEQPVAPVEPAPEVVVPKPVVEQQLHGNADY